MHLQNCGGNSPKSMDRCIHKGAKLRKLSDFFKPGTRNLRPGPQSAQQADDDIGLAQELKHVAFNTPERAFRHADAVPQFQRLVHEAALVDRIFEHLLEIFHLLVADHHHPAGCTIDEPGHRQTVVRHQ